MNAALVKLVFVFASMGSPWRVELEVKGASLQRDRIEANLSNILRLYDETFSDWLETSELRRHEKQGLAIRQKASPLFMEGLQEALALYEYTDGVFDISTGAMTWGLKKKSVGLAGLKLRGGEFVFLKDPLRLSFGGIVKGMAMGALAQALADLPIENLFIDAGGSSRLNVARQVSGSFKAEFVSSSEAAPNGVMHIFNGRGNSLEKKKTRVNCVFEMNSLSKFDWPHWGAWSDALSTALVVNSKLKIPPECSVEF